METTIWSADLALGIPLFDEAHQAMAEQVKQLLEGPDQQFPTGMMRLIEALEEDFRLEESLMEAIDYPAIRSHREQHARVLATLHGLAPDDIAAGREAAGLILPWFQLHLATADTALAVALQTAGRTASRTGCLIQGCAAGRRGGAAAPASCLPGLPPQLRTVSGRPG